MKKNKSSKQKIMLYVLPLVIIVGIGLLLSARPNYEDPGTPKASKGTPGASVLIEEFADLQCPACRTASPVVNQILEEYGDVVEFKYYHFPLSYHEFAMTAAQAAECANDQGKYYEYIDLVYLNQANIRQSDLIGYGNELGFDASFEACVKSGVKAKYVRADQREGLARNVQATPTFFVNGAKLNNWDYNTFKSVVEAALA